MQAANALRAQIDGIMQVYAALRPSLFYFKYYISYFVMDLLIRMVYMSLMLFSEV